MRPGKVIEVLGSGNVKVAAPGLFSEQDIENLPTCMPFFLGAANSYSEPEVGQEVWVLNAVDNPLQVFWFRKDQREDNAYMESLENVEVLCNRPTGMGFATIYFSDGTGWVIKGNQSYIQIKADGSILLQTGMTNRCIHICGDSISLGSVGGSSWHPAKGEKVQDALNAIATILNLIKTAAESFVPLMPLGAAIEAGYDILKQSIDEINSTNVTMN